MNGLWGQLAGRGSWGVARARGCVPVPGAFCFPCLCSLLPGTMDGVAFLHHVLLLGYFCLAAAEMDWTPRSSVSEIQLSSSKLWGRVLVQRWESAWFTRDEAGRAPLLAVLIFPFLLFACLFVYFQHWGSSPELQAWQANIYYELHFWAPCWTINSSAAFKVLSEKIWGKCMIKRLKLW